MSQKFGSTDTSISVAVSVRMPKSVRDRLQSSAEKSRRSMNSEIVFLLETVLSPENEKAEAVAPASA